MTKLPIAFDLETHLFGPGNMAPKVVCLSYADDSRKAGVIVGHDNIENWLHSALDSAIVGGAVLVGANTAYDFGCILAHFPSVFDKVWRAYENDGVTCVQNRERLLDIATGEFGFPLVDGKKFKSKYSLKDIAKVRLGRDIEKGEATWRMRYAELDGVPLDQWPDAAKEYAIGDAKTTLDIWKIQEVRVGELRYQIPTQFHDARAQLALHLMSVWGARIDQARVLSTWNEYADRMSDLAAGIIHSGLASVVSEASDLFAEKRRSLPELKKSNAAIRAAIERFYPGTPPRTKPTSRFPEGQIKTGEEVIVLCPNDALQKVVEFSKLQKLCNTYLNKMFAPIIHPRFYAVGSISDRTSCSGPNIQNLPRMPGVRECIVAREGSVLLFTDFDSQEMRTLGQSCIDILGVSKLADRYRADRYYDPHLEFAARLAQIDIEDARKLYAAKDPKIKGLRQQAKVANFGFPGGLAAKTLVAFAAGWGVTISGSRAIELRDAWFEQLPEMSPYFQHAQTLVGEAGYGTQINPRTGFRRGLVTYTEASNGYFQHLAAVASKQALWEITKRAYAVRESYLYGSRPVLFVHDEIALESPEVAISDASKEMECVMIEAMEKWTPSVPSAASATAMRRWSKKAERVTDNKGRLVVWGE